MNRPKVFLVVCVFEKGEFCYEIYQRLGFYGCTGSTFYVELTELDGPLSIHPAASGLFIAFLMG